MSGGDKASCNLINLRLNFMERKNVEYNERKTSERE